MKPSGRCARRAVVALLAGVLVAGAAAGCGYPGARHGSAGHGGENPGKVVASLSIPYQTGSGVDAGSARTVNVQLRVGQRFSIKVATSDGPFGWRQAGPAPATRIVQVVGDFNEGHCPKLAVGCRVPYFHIMRAAAVGATTMTWLYRDLACSPARKRMVQTTQSCFAAITFDITVR